MKGSKGKCPTGVESVSLAVTKVLFSPVRTSWARSTGAASPVTSMTAVATSAPPSVTIPATSCSTAMVTSIIQNLQFSFCLSVCLPLCLSVCLSLSLNIYSFSLTSLCLTGESFLHIYMNLSHSIHVLRLCAVLTSSQTH